MSLEVPLFHKMGSSIEFFPPGQMQYTCFVIYLCEVQFQLWRMPQECELDEEILKYSLVHSLLGKTMISSLDFFCQISSSCP